MTVGESWVVTPETAPLFADESSKELNMMFQFEHLMLDEQPNTSKWQLKSLDLPEFKQVFNKWQTQLPETTWNSLFWNNHDTPRVVSRFGDDQNFRVESAKMLAILLHMMKGTPYIYQGEEIGMTNYPIQQIDQAQDIESLNLYEEKLAEGWTEAEIMEAINAKGRDNARTPMQWTADQNGGFTDGEPWMTVNPNTSEVNVQAALDDRQSVFYTYQKLIQLRKEHPIIVKGTFKLLLKNHPQIFAYERIFEGETWIVAANFSPETIHCSLTETPTPNIPMIANYDRSEYDLNELTLAPYEAFVVKVESNEN